MYIFIIIIIIILKASTIYMKVQITQIITFLNKYILIITILKAKRIYRRVH